MSNTIQKAKTQYQLDVRNTDEKAVAVRNALEYVRGESMAALSSCDPAPISDEMSKIDIVRVSRLFRITDVVYAKHEDFLQKATTLAYTAWSLRAKIIILLTSSGTGHEYMMGISMPYDKASVPSVGSGFERAFHGAFAGSKTKPMENDELRDVLGKCFNENGVYTSISGVPSLRGADRHSVESFVQGMENLTDTLRGKSYTLMVIAEPAPHESTAGLRAAYQDIYTRLSPFARTECGFNGSESSMANWSTANGISTSVTHTRSQGRSETDSTSENHSHTVTHGKTRDTVGKAAMSLGGAFLGGVLGGTIGAGVGAMIGNSVGGLFGTVSDSTSDTTSNTTSHSVSTSTNESEGTTEGKQTIKSVGGADQSTLGRSIQFAIEDRVVADTMKMIEKDLDRLDKCESFGAFSTAAYVISNRSEVNHHVASVFAALMRGDGSDSSASYIHTWNAADGGAGKTVGEYLRRFSHPEFEFDLGNGKAFLSPAMILSGDEVSIAMCLPKRSVHGVSVREMAEFDCDAPTPQGASCRLGPAQRYGQKLDNASVELDANSLASHTFISGSTGAGKSNTIYKMIDELCMRGDANFLVIEPAKGEYKDVFGSSRGVSVYGTNPYRSPLLRIDPFSFPDDIHVLEHLDRLIEIFGACWPMYAAMPAVLKQAVERAYEDCGWDLMRSKNKYGEKIYPSFRDVARNIKKIIDSSEYDAENKGAYKGALLTRLESLTNGINGMIFVSDEVSGEDLFDKNVIVDISRVGSSETKALIMGMLVLKLQEHRMSHADGMNADLKHITVIEEAHALLRRTQRSGSPEVADLQGKSVEMLANIIAEMRTYGEGFIIADQSPGLLDMSVIRNTNTKIIMRLPDREDRELVGRAAGLNDDQIDDIAKLECGVAAVYQNEWRGPVLCAVDRYQPRGGGYKYEPTDDLFIGSDAAKTSLLDCIMNKELTLHLRDRSAMREMKRMIVTSGLDSSVKADFMEYISSGDDAALDHLRRLIYDFTSAENAINGAKHHSEIKGWVRAVVDALEPSINGYTPRQIDLAVAMILYEHSLRDPEYDPLMASFTELYKRGGGVY